MNEGERGREVSNVGANEVEVCRGEDSSGEEASMVRVL